MNALNATLHGGPFDGLEVCYDRPHLDFGQTGADQVTIVGWHTYRASNAERTDYEYVGYRERMSQTGFG